MKNILLGKTRDHLVPLEGTKFFIHADMLRDFQNLQREAFKDGFDLSIVSAFRDYERQLFIWNRKVTNSELPPVETIFQILRWSALPGASRHHWGTDIDIFDASTQRIEDVKLTPEEVSEGGPSARLHDWLDEKIHARSAFGFYRPYANDRNGIAPERWHLSYSPLSQKYFQSYTLDLFLENIETSEMLLKEIVKQHAEEIFQRFFLNVELP